MLSILPYPPLKLVCSWGWESSSFLVILLVKMSMNELLNWFQDPSWNMKSLFSWLGNFSRIQGQTTFPWDAVPSHLCVQLFHRLLRVILLCCYFESVKKLFEYIFRQTWQALYVVSWKPKSCIIWAGMWYFVLHKISPNLLGSSVSVIVIIDRISCIHQVFTLRGDVYSFFC